MIEQALQILGAIAIGTAGGFLGMKAMLWAGSRLRALRGPVPVAPILPLTAQEFTIIGQWAQINPWYLTDQRLNMEAQAVHGRLRHEEPHLSLDDNLAKVAAEMKRRHPEIAVTRH